MEIGKGLGQREARIKLSAHRGQISRKSSKLVNFSLHKSVFESIRKILTYLLKSWSSGPAWLLVDPDLTFHGIFSRGGKS